MNAVVLIVSSAAAFIIGMGFWTWIDKLQRRIRQLESENGLLRYEVEMWKRA